MRKILVITGVLVIASLVLAANADRMVGFIVAIRGDVTVERIKTAEEGEQSEETLQAKLNSDIFDRDEVTTGEESRAKIRFMDDSTVTMSTNTTLSVAEYIKSREGERGKSLLKLIEGKIRAISGKNKLEVHTPTAAVATRGTEFFVYVFGTPGKMVTEITCIDGVLVVRNIQSKVSGEVTLKKGQVTQVPEMVKPKKPAPVSKERYRQLLLECKIEAMKKMGY